LTRMSICATSAAIFMPIQFSTDWRLLLNYGPTRTIQNG
jgi:hypothetical protein